MPFKKEYPIWYLGARCKFGRSGSRVNYKEWSKNLAKRSTIERISMMGTIGLKDLMDWKKKRMLHRAGFLLSKGFFVVANKVRSIIKVFDVVSSILFWVIPFPAY